MKINFNPNNFYINNRYKKENKPSFGSAVPFDYEGDIYTPDEIEMIKREKGSLNGRIKTFKDLILSKYGYSRGLVPHNITNVDSGYTACFIPVRGEFEILRKKFSNPQLFIDISHELRHFMQYANIFKAFGLDEAEYIMRNRTIEGLIEKLDKGEIKENNEDTVKEIIYALANGVPMLNRTFWRKAVRQTPETSKNWQRFLDRMIEERISGYSQKPGEKPAPVSSVYEYFSRKRDYIRNPFEEEAYHYNEKLMDIFHLQDEDLFEKTADELEALEKAVETAYPDENSETKNTIIINTINKVINENNLMNKELSAEDRILILQKAKESITQNRFNISILAENNGYTPIPIPKEMSVLNTEDIDFIHNLQGTFEEKVSDLKILFLKKFGYKKDILPHTINSELKDGEYSSEGKFNFHKGILKIAKNETLSNEELAAIIGHEIRHFYQFAKLFQFMGVNAVNEIIEKGNSSWLKAKEEDYKTCLNKKDEPLSEKEIKWLEYHLKKDKKTLEPFNLKFWKKVVEETDKNDSDMKKFAEYFIKTNKELKTANRYAEIYNFYKDNRDYMLNPFEKDANNYETNLRKNLGLDNSIIEDALLIAKNFDKLEKILDKLPRTENLKDNEDYFYFIFNKTKDLKKYPSISPFKEGKKYQISLLNTMYNIAQKLYKESLMH